jgi:hypothetical protein
MSFCALNTLSMVLMRSCAAQGPIRTTEGCCGQHFNNAAANLRYATMLKEGHRCFGRQGMSVRYEGSGSFAAILATAKRSE